MTRISTVMNSTARLKQFIREEISRRPVRPIGEVDGAEGAKEVTGSIDSVAKNVAEILGKPELVSPLTAAIKKAKGGKDAKDLSTTDKNALAEVFLELVFTKPKLLNQVSQHLKKVVAK